MVWVPKTDPAPADLPGKPAPKRWAAVDLPLDGVGDSSAHVRAGLPVGAVACLPVHHSSPLPSFDNSPPSSPMILHPGGPRIPYGLGIETLTGNPQAPRAPGSMRCEDVVRAPPLFRCLRVLPAPALLQPEVVQASHSPGGLPRVYPTILFSLC